jgi:hypothetical protein
MTDVTATATRLGRQATEKAREFANTNPVAKKAKDVIYTAVGAGVLSAQKAAAAAKGARPEFDTDGLGAQLKKGVDDVASQLKRWTPKIDEHLAAALKHIDDALAPVEDKLPASVRETRIKVRDFATKLVGFSATPETETDEK